VSKCCGIKKKDPKGKNEVGSGRKIALPTSGLQGESEKYMQLVRGAEVEWNMGACRKGESASSKGSTPPVCRKRNRSPERVSGISCEPGTGEGRGESACAKEKEICSASSKGELFGQGRDAKACHEKRRAEVILVPVRQEKKK